MNNSNMTSVLGQIVRLIESITPDDANLNTNADQATSTAGISTTTSTSRRQNSRTQVSGQESQVLNKKNLFFIYLWFINISI